MSNSCLQQGIVEKQSSLFREIEKCCFRIAVAFYYSKYSGAPIFYAILNNEQDSIKNILQLLENNMENIKSSKQVHEDIEFLNKKIQNKKDKESYKLTNKAITFFLNVTLSKQLK